MLYAHPFQGPVVTQIIQEILHRDWRLGRIKVVCATIGRCYFIRVRAIVDKDPQLLVWELTREM